MARPLVTVVTVTFNPGASLAPTLASVQSQSLRANLEYLVFDGASTDGSVEVLKGAAARAEVDGWRSEPDRGIYDAMNKAVAAAQGDYVLFLNAGDTFPQPDTLERLFEPPLSGVDFLWGDCVIASAGRVVLDRADRMLRFLYRQMTVSHQSLAIRTSLLQEHPFDLALKVAADYEVLCHLVAAGHQGRYQPVVVSRVEEEGFSSRHFFVGWDEKRSVSRRYFPREQWRAVPYFALWGLYVKLKIWYKERS